MLLHLIDTTFPFKPKVIFLHTLNHDSRHQHKQQLEAGHQKSWLKWIFSFLMSSNRWGQPFSIFCGTPMHQNSRHSLKLDELLGFQGTKLAWNEKKTQTFVKVILIYEVQIHLGTLLLQLIIRWLNFFRFSIIVLLSIEESSYCCALRSRRIQLPYALLTKFRLEKLKQIV